MESITLTIEVNRKHWFKWQRSVWFLLSNVSGLSQKIDVRGIAFYIDPFDSTWIKPRVYAKKKSK